MKQYLSAWLFALLLVASSIALAQGEIQPGDRSTEDQPVVVAPVAPQMVDTGEEDGEARTDSEEETTIPAIVTELARQFSDLDDREKEQIKQALSQLNQGVNVGLPHPQGQSIGETIVAVVAISLTVGMPVIIVTLILVAGHRKRKQQVALIEKFLDAGKDVPKEILVSLDRDSAGGNNLRRGLILTGTGIGLFLFLGFVAGWPESTIGLIPLFIGLAQLLIWKIETAGKERSEQS